MRGLRRIRTPTMALSRSLNRFELPVHTISTEPLDRDVLGALSQRKLNALGVPLAYVDRNQRYRFVNKAFLDWLGRTEAEIVGREVIEVIGREVFQLYRAYIDAALSGERTTYERQLVTAGRPPLWIRVDYYPERSAQGHVRGFLVTYSDVNHLKRLELEAGQREHRLRLVTDSVGLPILYFDRQLKIRFANKPFGKWLGVPADDVPGHPLKDVLPADAFAEMQGYIERAFAGATVSYERRERQLDGEARWTRVTLFPDREMGGRVGGAFAVMNDIEEDVRIREALKSQESQMRSFADNIPGPDRVPRPQPALHVRQPGVRQLGLQAAGRDLRQDAVRDHAVRRRQLPAADRQARAGGRTRRVRAHRQHHAGTTALAARAHRAGPRCVGHRARSLLHRIRHPRPEAHRAGARRARGAAAPLQRQHSGADRLSRSASAATSSSTRHSCASSACIATRSSARPPMKSWGRTSSARWQPGRERVFAGEAITYEREVVDASGPHALDPCPLRARPATSTVR